MSSLIATLGKSISREKAGIRFAIQGDIHSYRRIPRPYMVKLINDLPKIGADMFFILGDYTDRDYPIVMELSKMSKVPIFYQHGDHEFFGDWTAGLYTRNYVKGKAEGKPCNPLIYMFGGFPRCEVLTRLPRFWSFIFKDIHFILTFNGKFEVWPTWFLRWLDTVLKEHRELTTVILSHRPLYEDGSCAEALRKIVEKNRQIKLYCYAHRHEGAPLDFLGKTLLVPAELISKHVEKKTYEGNWYIFIEIVKTGIKVFRRYISKGESKLVYFYKTETTLGGKDTAYVHLPYIVPDKGRFNVSPLQLHTGKIRIWSLVREEIFPNPLLEKNTIVWKSFNRARIDVVDASNLKLSLLGVKHVVRVKVKDIDGSPLNPAKICEAILPVKFNEDEIGESGSISGGTLYDFLLIAQIPVEKTLRLIVDGVAHGEIVESHQYINVKGCNGISSAVLRVGHLKINDKWYWMSFHTKSGEVMVEANGPRRANRLKVSLAVPENVKDTEYFFILLVYPHEGLYTLIDEGIKFSQNIRLKINDNYFYVDDIKPETFREMDIGEINSKTSIEVQCNGSKLVIIELLGKTYVIPSQ